MKKTEEEVGRTRRRIKKRADKQQVLRKKRF